MVAPVLGRLTMETCLICKELVDERYTLETKNTEVNTTVQGFVCRFCFNKFVDSAHGNGYFSVVRMKNWLRKMPHMRAI